jgi:hypothetical protein
MSVKIFTKDEFEQAIATFKPESLGLDQGEYTYIVATSHDQVRIKVRSSVHSSGKSAQTGEDSIRLILEVKAGKAWKPVGKGPDAYTTRVRGWQKRLNDKINAMRAKAARIKHTIRVNEKVRYAKTPQNAGRPLTFVYNPATGKDQFARWLDV